MSAINVHVTLTQGFLATDTTAYDENGTAQAWVTKTVPLLPLRSAIGTRGRVDVGWRLAGMIGTGVLRAASCIDHILPELETLFLDAYGGSVWQAPATDFDGWIVGWSERESRVIAETFVYAVDETLAGFTGFRRVRVADGLYLGPPLLNEFAHAYREVKAPETFIDLAKRQRRYFEKYEPDHRIAGDLVLTTVTRRGVEQRVIYSWPDEIANAQGLDTVREADRV